MDIGQIENIGDCLPICLLIIDNKKNIVYMNCTALELSGYSIDEIKGKQCSILFENYCDGFGLDCFLNHYDETTKFTINLKSKDGREISVEKAACALLDDKLNVIGGIEVFSQSDDPEKEAGFLKKEIRSIRKKLEQWQELLNVGISITSSLSIPRITSRLINTLKRTFGYDRVAIYTPDDKKQLELVARTENYKKDESKHATQISENPTVISCFESGEPILISKSKDTIDISSVQESELSEIAMPIKFQEKVFGVIFARGDESHYFQKSDVSILSTVSNFAATALNNANLTKDISSAMKRYETLFNESSDPIFITNIENTKFLDCNQRAVSVYGYNKYEIIKIDPNFLIDNQMNPGATSKKAFKGNWEGIHVTKNGLRIYVESRSTVIDWGISKANLIIARDISRRKRLEEKLKLLSISDELTGLYNRRYFMNKFQEEIERCRRYELPLALIIIDVDNFKEYNDKNGHTAGDKLLESLGKILREQVRTSDIPCRYGGDEFTIILTHTDVYSAKKIAERIQRSYNSLELTETSLSIGLTKLHKSDSIEDLINRADSALYSVKRKSGRGGISSIE